MKSVFGFRGVFRPLFFAFVCGTFTVQSFAQGTVWFANHVSGQVETKIYAPEQTWYCMPLAGYGTNDLPRGTIDFAFAGMLPIGTDRADGRWRGSTTFAQLLAAPGANQPESSLIPALPTTTFRTGSAAGRLAPVIVTLNGVPMDAPVATVMVAVWDNSSGFYPTWNQAKPAWLQGQITAATSPRFNVSEIGGINAPPPLTGLVSFNVTYLPMAPFIYNQPRDLVAVAGSNPTLTIGATAGWPSAYQWYFDGNPIPGANSASCIITNAQSAAEGAYHVVVSYCYSISLQSSPARLTIIQRNPELRTAPPYGGVAPEGFWFSLLSEPGVLCQIDSSTNLVDWEPFATQANPTGTLRLTNTLPPASARFFKAKKAL